MGAREGAAVVGRWWGRVPTGTQRQTRSQDIDIVAADSAGSVIATGSCKWTNTRLSRAEDHLLIATETHIPGAGAVARHYFCSRTGFTADLLRLAETDRERYRLVTPEDVYAAP